MGRPRGAVLRELDLFVPEAHADDSHACAEDALQAVCSCPATSISDTSSKVSTSLKNATERSMSDTVIPTASTECAIASDAARGVADGNDQATNAATTSRVRTSAHPFTNR